MKYNELKFLKLYSLLLTALFGFFLLSGFNSSNSNMKFDEITVERINVVEPDGKLKMVISNQEKQHPGMMNGKTIKKRRRPSGIIFFNEEQDEVGGLIYEGNKDIGASFALSVDQYKNDQVMQLNHSTKKDGENRYGIQLWQRNKNYTTPRLLGILDSLTNAGNSQNEINNFVLKLNEKEKLASSRLFLGKQFNHATGMFVKDQDGVDRLRIYVDENNNQKLEVLNVEGKVIKDLINN